MRLSPLPASFYNRSVLDVARDLLGARLVRVLADGSRITGVINETEAYQGESDLACHARAGRTPRTEVMYGPPGRAYVYFIYGMHWMLNVVAEPEGSPAAVLIRSIIPVEGLEQVAQRRAAQRRNGSAVTRPQDWTNGPARLCQALSIDGRFNGAALDDSGGELWIAVGEPVPESRVARGPRVGIPNVPEPWRSIPWRFQIDDGQWRTAFENSRNRHTPAER